VWRSERRDASSSLIVSAANYHEHIIPCPVIASLGLLRTLSGSCEKEGMERRSKGVMELRSVVREERRGAA
jgi:hypothetical protein